ncbi:hypothetical protein ANN_01517 [Periplaneta americana]|uniref:BHLH domain-containing protein n=1 Tax=Periplaneta americana TaxID=6978 RepID=A0ABQ8TWS9_PERAM|nr:hypothetical protein ANN_01517 [Periplaneta americana]
MKIWLSGKALCEADLNNFKEKPKENHNASHTEFVCTQDGHDEVHKKETNTSIDLSPHNINNCHHWYHRCNFENETPADSDNNTAPIRTCCLRRSDPFLPENRIPLPKFQCNKTENGEYEELSNCDNGVFFYTMPTPTNGRRRNERERQRVRSVNEGFERLRRYLPTSHQCARCEADPESVAATVSKIRRCHRRRYSKVDVLRAAIVYIRHLQEILGEVELTCR